MPNYTEKDIDSFLSISSFNGLQVLFAFHLAKKSHVAFNFVELAKAVNWSKEGEYQWGFFVACVSVGLISMKEHKGIYNVTGMNEFLEKKIEQRLIENANALDKKSPMEVGNRLDSIDAIRKYFE